MEKKSKYVQIKEIKIDRKQIILDKCKRCIIFLYVRKREIERGREREIENRMRERKREIEEERERGRERGIERDRKTENTIEWNR